MLRFPFFSQQQTPKWLPRVFSYDLGVAFLQNARPDGAALSVSAALFAQSVSGTAQEGPYVGNETKVAILFNCSHSCDSDWSLREEGINACGCSRLGFRGRSRIFDCPSRRWSLARDLPGLVSSHGHGKYRARHGSAHRRYVCDLRANGDCGHGGKCAGIWFYHCHISDHMLRGSTSVSR
jgi:hypothetical protein